jgi:hypothetical protein
MIWLLAILGQVGHAQAPTTAPSEVPRVVFTSTIGKEQLEVILKQRPPDRLEVVLKERRATTKPAADGRSPVQSGQTISPLFVDTYFVRRVSDKDPAGTVLWQYDRNVYDDSDRMRYRVLSATLIYNYVFIVEKQRLGTSIGMIRLGDENGPSTPLGWKSLLADSDAEGPIVVSAIVCPGVTLGDSWVVLNYDQVPKYRKDFRLSDCFPDVEK